MSDVERARLNLRAHYRESLQKRLVVLDEWVESFDAADGAQLAEIRRAGHQMRGSGASYGFQTITDLGGAVEDAPVDQVPAALEQLVDEVRRALFELDAQLGPDTDL